MAGVGVYPASVRTGAGTIATAPQAGHRRTDGVGSAFFDPPRQPQRTGVSCRQVGQARGYRVPRSGTWCSGRQGSSLAWQVSYLSVAPGRLPGPLVGEDGDGSRPCLLLEKVRRWIDTPGSRSLLHPPKRPRGVPCLSIEAFTDLAVSVLLVEVVVSG